MKKSEKNYISRKFNTIHFQTLEKVDSNIIANSIRNIFASNDLSKVHS